MGGRDQDRSRVIPVLGVAEKQQQAVLEAALARSDWYGVGQRRTAEVSSAQEVTLKPVSWSCICKSVQCLRINAAEHRSHALGARSMQCARHPW